MGFKKILDNDSPQPREKDTGSWGEDVAAELLVTKGYAIVERRWRCGHYEIDLIAQKGGRIVFVEVKTRLSAYLDPVDAVTPAKQKRIIRAADAYMRMSDIPFEYQFDIITIVGPRTDYSIQHIPDAFFPSMK